MMTTADVRIVAYKRRRWPPGPDQFLVFDVYDHVVWPLQGADPEKLCVAPPRR
jgi:hypothetical protein